MKACLSRSNKQILENVGRQAIWQSHTRDLRFFSFSAVCSRAIFFLLCNDLQQSQEPLILHRLIMSEERAKKRSKTAKEGKEVDPKDNPYLAHLQPTNESSEGDFYGLTSGNTTAAQAERVEDGDINPFNNKPFSAKYKKILEGRRKLPVHAQRDEFLEMVHNNQIIVLVGETGSGKTTQ